MCSYVVALGAARQPGGRCGGIEAVATEARNPLVAMGSVWAHSQEVCSFTVVLYRSASRHAYALVHSAEQ